MVGVGYKAKAEAEGASLIISNWDRVTRLNSLFLQQSVFSASKTTSFAASVHSCNPAEVYKGKVILYIDEVIKTKQGEKSK